MTLRVPEMGVPGFGGTHDERAEDLLVELRAYAAPFFRDAARFMATTRATHAGALLRFALSTEEAQRRMLGEVQETEPHTRGRGDFQDILHVRLGSSRRVKPAMRAR